MWTYVEVIWFMSTVGWSSSVWIFGGLGKILFRVNILWQAKPLFWMREALGGLSQAWEEFKATVLCVPWMWLCTAHPRNLRATLLEPFTLLEPLYLSFYFLVYLGLIGHIIKWLSRWTLGWKQKRPERSWLVHVTSLVSEHELEPEDCLGSEPRSAIDCGQVMLPPACVSSTATWESR